MTESGWQLSTPAWEEWLYSMLEGDVAVIAPLPGATGAYEFRRVESAREAAAPHPGRTPMSPKELLFPRSEVLFSFELTGEAAAIARPEGDHCTQLLVGVRPCDAAGLRRLDQVFLDKPADLTYSERRQRTVIISEACSLAEPSCFCTAVGGSPNGKEGADLLLTRLEGSDDLLLEPVTETGTELVAKASASWRGISPEQATRAARQAEAAAASITRAPLPPETPDILASSFDSPAWAEVAPGCISCGICTYACPSCSCFDITDSGSASCGSRCRSWDSCAFAGFTRHASGHNPRPDQPSRYRQRVMHKFSYFPAEHGGELMCVGCGRCIDLCPAGVDIHRAVSALAGAAPEKPMRESARPGVRA